jgi:hypothetical protein
MIRNRKFVPIALSLALAAVALGLYVYTRAHAAPTYTLANGVEVTPITVQPDDASKLLEMKFWKLDVVQTDASKPLFFNLSLCRNGKLTKSLTYTYGLGPSSRKPSRVHNHIPVTVGLVPVGDTFFGAKQLKYSLSTALVDTSGVIPNVFFKTRGFVSDTQAPYVSREGNLVFLLSANKNNPTTSDPMRNDTTLALSIETPPIAH